MFYLGNQNTASAVHHIAVMFGSSYWVAHGDYAYCFMFNWMLAELSRPFLDIKMCLRYYRVVNWKLYLLVEVCHMISFTVPRIIVVGFTTYIVFIVGCPHRVIIISAVAICIYSIRIMLMMSRLAQKRYQEYKKRCLTNTCLNWVTSNNEWLPSVLVNQKHTLK